MKHKHKILKLRSEGKSYKQISKILKCSIGTVCYHCCPGMKEKFKSRTKIFKQNNPIKAKMYHYLSRKYVCKSSSHNENIKRKLYDKYNDFKRRNKMYNETFTFDELLTKLGTEPKCYLTGEIIDLNKPNTYEFDHKIPASRGGDNSLNNLGLLSKLVNKSKHNMTPDEFINLCRRVVNYADSMDSLEIASKS